MKKRAVMFLFMLAAALSPVLAFAEEVAANPMPAIEVPAGHWWSGIVSWLVPMLITALITVSGFVSKFINTKLAEARTSESGKWYGTAFNLAGIAVRAAETYFGPDTGTGVKKKEQARQWLKERLIAIDPSILTKTPNLDSLLSGFIDAAYHDAFVAIAPLK